MCACTALVLSRQSVQFVLTTPVCFLVTESPARWKKSSCSAYLATCRVRGVMMHYLAGRYLAVQLVHALVAALRVEVPEDVGHVGVRGDLHVSTVQYSTVQYSTVQYSTVQYSTVQYSTVQYSTVLYISVTQPQTDRHSLILK